MVCNHIDIVPDLDEPSGNQLWEGSHCKKWTAFVYLDFIQNIKIIQRHALQYSKTVNINQKLLPCWAGNSRLVLLVLLEKALACLVNSSALGSAGASAHPSGTRHGAAWHLWAHKLCKHTAICTDDEGRFWKGCSTEQLLCAHVAVLQGQVLLPQAGEPPGTWKD